jgi:hypothetical protein
MDIEDCNECALHVNQSDNKICMTPDSLGLLVRDLNVKSKNPTKQLDEIKHKLNLVGQPESKVLEHDKVKTILGDDADKELIENFKPIGPLGPKPLSSHEIDQVIDQWKHKWTELVNLHYNMINFEEYGGTMKIPIKDIIEQKISSAKVITENNPVDLTTKSGKRPKYITAVVNSDVQGGPGKHWTCIFIDLSTDTWTLEFFNSSGNSPYNEIIKWWAKNKIDLEKYVEPRGTISINPLRVSDIIHQRAATTCGPYSLYYIWSRLNGIPASAFKHSELADEVVQTFIKTHVFRN